MKTPIKGIVSICLLGSSLFVGSFSFAETIFPQEAPKQDISVFIWKLASRLQWVFGEIVDLSMGKGLVFSTGVNQTGNLPYLVDIKWHAHQDDIEFLVQKGVVDPNREKFYPENFLRRYELAIMYVKYQLVKGNKSLPLITMPTIGWFADVAQNASYAPYVAYGVQENRLTAFVSKDTEGKKYFLPNAFVQKDEVLRLINLPVGSGDDIVIKRGEFAHLLVQGSIDGLFTTAKSEPIADTIVDADAIPDNDSPILDGNQVLSTLKTLFALAK